MRTACIVAAILNMSLIRSLTTRVSPFSRQCSFPTSSLRALSSSSEHYSVSEDNWTEYMIEFRGIQAAFRLNELRDSYKHVMKGTDKEDLVLTSIIADVLFPDIPICAYVKLPNDTIAIDITKRCSLVRSVSQVWGDSSTFNGVRDEAEKKYDSLIAPHFNNGLGNNSWRVDFRRYGRSGKSGLDPEGKKNVLLKFNTIFKKMDSQVDLFESKHSLLYLEDWSTYRPWVDSFAISKSTDTTTEKKKIVSNNDSNSGSNSNSNGDSNSSKLKEDDNNNSKNEINSENKNSGKFSKPYRSRISYMADAPVQLQQSQTDQRSDSSSSSSSSSSSRNIKKNKTTTLSLGEINHDDGTYVPLRFIFGRIITEGPNVLSDFDLRRRPYLGIQNLQLSFYFIT